MIETERLILRRWEDRDRAPFHAYCNDTRVMEHLGPLLSREESDAAIDRQNGWQDNLGYCFWAAESKADGALLGFCGLKPGAEDTPIEGAIEIGWRFGFHYWGQGYAREAAQASLDWAWAHLDATEVVAITNSGNMRSWKLMERLGMVRDPGGDFEHRRVPEGDRLRPHITYRATRPPRT